ncbi:MAG: hypothetical protein LBV13_02775 [Methanomassiliicoccaceae archaeon]|jgi:hypothetical protein|nr:hypothetical protein [Methanomassiliicoccaceae archaeon]
MSISIAICETECGSALCRRSKENVLKVLVRDPLRYGDAAEYELFLPVGDAMDAFDDREGFVKRNRIRGDIRTVYLDRLKDPEDRAVLERITERTYTGWIDLSKVADEIRRGLVSGSLPEDQQTEWDSVSFDEMALICASCELSWDKGRGCIGSFGPDNSLLPDIASRYGCAVTASVPAGVSEGRRYTKEDALLISSEIPILRDALGKEGKLAVKRYMGTVDRLEAVALISLREGCGFRFF